MRDANNNGPTIGVVAISYNEERDFPGFLENLDPWVDEVVVVDDGSTDQTSAIAATWGGKLNFLVSPRRKGEYYSHQRNKGIGAAQSDWLLHMDIDERVTPALAREICLAIRDPAFDAYRYRRLNYFLHRPMKGGGLADWNLVHLAKREMLRFGGMFHESCDVDVSPERVGQLREKMLHFNDESYVERLRKSAIYQKEVVGGILKQDKRTGMVGLAWAFCSEFARKYFWKRGIFDGVPGLIWALHAASASFRARAQVWDEQNRIERRELEEKLKEEWDQAGEVF